MMIPKEILNKIKSIEIKTRRIVNSTFTGGYHSVFKGHGISFSEVRNYSRGDDVRLIDWNVTAKEGSPYIKVFEEDRELTVILAIDISASGNFGSLHQLKKEVAAEIAAVIGFSACNNNDRVGLCLFSDHVERYISPNRGKNHVFRLLRDIFYFQPKSKGTSISSCLEYLRRIHKKKAIVFLISDFIDTNYESYFRLVQKRFDLVPILIQDRRESEWKKGGLTAFEDSETGEKIIINMKSQDIRDRFHNMMLARELEQERLFKSMGIEFVRIDVSKSYIHPLRLFFKKRQGHK